MFFCKLTKLNTIFWPFAKYLDIRMFYNYFLKIYIFKNCFATDP